MDLNIIWFGILGVLLAGYAILDGFDLGVGILHLSVKDDTERRILMNSIGPLWDGNEVWLVTFGGALFATMPHAYATAFSGFYLAFMLLLCALIFRQFRWNFAPNRRIRSGGMPGISRFSVLRLWRLFFSGWLSGIRFRGCRLERIWNLQAVFLIY